MLSETLKVGNTFLGWFTEPEGGGCEITEDTVVLINRDHTLYADWEANDYIITFDAQGGSITNPQTIEVTYGSQYGILPETSREFYIFDGWWTEPNGNGYLVTEETPITFVNDKTIYANWGFDVFEGPAGGLIFYVNPNYLEDGWKFLEAAPYGWYEGTEDSKGIYTGEDDPFFQWGADGYPIDPPAISVEIGDGETNTFNIVNFHDRLWFSSGKGDFYTNPTEYNPYSDGTVAAKVCSEYLVNHEGLEYDNWFLPAKDELNLMYQNLGAKNWGGFSQFDGFYWNSTSYEYGNYGAWTQNIKEGTQYGNARYGIQRVRPIRAF